MKKIVTMINVPGTVLNDLNSVPLEKTDLLVITGKVKDSDMESLDTILSTDKGTILWINPTKQSVEKFPDQIAGYRKQNGEVVTMLVPESPVFDGLEVTDLAWFGGRSVKDVPASAKGGYHVFWDDPKITVLAEEMQAHGSGILKAGKLKYWVTPLVTIKRGAGETILSEMYAPAAMTDPLALRFWVNMLSPMK